MNRRLASDPKAAKKKARKLRNEAKRKAVATTKAAATSKAVSISKAEDKKTEQKPNSRKRANSIFSPIVQVSHWTVLPLHGCRMLVCLPTRMHEVMRLVCVWVSARPTLCIYI